ncbi:MAG: LysR family transcriptional regulator [Deltaproteobacteria bacterium]|nr:LysR family transcriptional regulator [Deltaproteobacteria bacterium]
MDLYKLKTFRTVATLLNFNQAAKTLNCAQSTISAQIKSLEDEVGVLLFKRIKKMVVLTDAGEKMLDYTYKLLSIEEEALADITGKRNPVGTIRLMVPEAIAACYFPSIISEFITQYPTINFDISNCSTNSLEHELQIGSVDIAFLISEQINSSNLKSEIILKEKLVIVSSPDHPLADMKQVDISNLKSQTIFLPKAGCGYGLSFRQLLDANIAKPSSIIEFTSIEAIKKCVMQGIGLTILPKQSVQKEVYKNLLVELDWISDFKTSILMVWHKDKRISKVLHVLMEIIRRTNIPDS